MMRDISREALLKEFYKAKKTMEQHGREYACSFLSPGQEISTEWYFVEDIVENMPAADALDETLCHVRDRSDNEEFEEAVFKIIQKSPTVEPERSKSINKLTLFENLKPCPFCGSDAYVSVENGTWKVECFSCKAKVEHWQGSSSTPTAKRQACEAVIKKWNERRNDEEH